MKERFKCESVYQARVLYEYLHYLATDFAVQKEKNGTTAILGIAALSSQGLYKYYSYLKDNLHNNLTNAYIQYLLEESQYRLSDYINTKEK